ncbi:hypothetical protein DAEQUDRAFT_41209 [Daedalea quercina L-15889]|uniref:Uncharacterized protein n=1 Tax=Daedalea quercina L-15889 TaxID=1314783 RepID=A0A165LE00_9APHY|nr:hypothetical protein DAEQUDRAFT_41209 [Daedalea quercina L-15889]
MRFQSTSTSLLRRVRGATHREAAHKIKHPDLEEPDLTRQAVFQRPYLRTDAPSTRVQLTAQALCFRFIPTLCSRRIVSGGGDVPERHRGETAHGVPAGRLRRFV